MNNVRTEPPPTYNTQPYTPPTRPALRYHGSKWQLAGWIISYLPPHDLYCEPFCGASAVLLNKPRSPLECINDLDGEVVNYFQVLRDYPDELIRVIELTPFAKKEWALSNQPTPDPVEAARRFYVRAYMNIAGPTATWRQGWRRQKTYTRKNGRAGMIAAAESFAKTDHLYDIANRLRGVTIENDDAFKIFERYDSPHACFYVDPPYPTSTRSSGAANTYAHEMTDDEHGRLSDTLHNLAGHVLISGYQCDLYDDLYHDWPRVDRKARTNSNTKPTAVESIWISPSAWDAIDRPTQLDLFEKETQP
jgi:DNA adenine methylase